MAKRRKRKDGERACIACDEHPCICDPPPKRKCDADDICGSLLRHLNVEANRGKGLSSFVLTNIDGNSKDFGGTQFAGVVYRDSASDNGVLINFCPWCGVSLDHFLTSKKWTPR